ncbi:hypothetical protein F4778DRAFT_784787 [Xylariomycetidae sp. FL2044]|nr:hypothetical protein F4778DRAFT_784787 [Xylariomycetidae sp. FL2044]
MTRMRVFRLEWAYIISNNMMLLPVFVTLALAASAPAQSAATREWCNLNRWESGYRCGPRSYQIIQRVNYHTIDLTSCHESDEKCIYDTLGQPRWVADMTGMSVIVDFVTGNV